MIFIPTPFNFTLFVFQQNNLCNLCKSTQNLHSDTILTAWLFVLKTSTDNFITTPLWKDSVGWCHFRQCQLVSFPTVSAGVISDSVGWNFTIFTVSRQHIYTPWRLVGNWGEKRRLQTAKTASVCWCHFRQCRMVSFPTVLAGVISDSVSWCHFRQCRLELYHFHDVPTACLHSSKAGG